MPEFMFWPRIKWHAQTFRIAIIYATYLSNKSLRVNGVTPNNWLLTKIWVPNQPIIPQALNILIYNAILVIT
jgi:hypothetical protein